MDFELNDEQKMFQDMARQFAEREMMPNLKENIRQDRFDRELMRKLGAQGLLAPHFPQEYGGLGLDFLTCAVIWEQLAYASLAVTQAATSSTVQPGTTILVSGREEQREKYLPPAATGESILVGAVVEPNAGSDSTRIETSARRKGDRWIINGNKIFITNGDVGDVFMVVAQTDKSKGMKGLTSFIVEKDTPGFSSAPLHGKIGWLGGSEGSLRFDDVEIPLENQLGETGAALRNALKGIDTARLFLSAGCVGLAQSCLDSCVKYSKERVQFGKPIGGHQLVQGVLAQMAMKIEAARLLAYRVAEMKTRGLKHIKEMAYAKYFAQETAVWVSAEAVKMHGAFGTVDDYPVGRHYQDSIVATILGGTEQMHQLTIGQHLTGLAAFF